MFTGIVEEVGKIKAVKHLGKSMELEIQANKVLEGTQLGDSICTNGVCLTVTRLSPTGFSVDVMPETMRKTALGDLKVGSSVNLERALTLSTRLGGHIVSGHIDGTGRICKRHQDDTAIWLHIECDSKILRYIIEKGSITIQGVSLTVVNVDETSFSVSLIPHTQQNTTLHSMLPGDLVNLENDILAKYVEKLLGKSDSSSKLESLLKQGFA